MKRTVGGVVPVTTHRDGQQLLATLTSVTPSVTKIPPNLLDGTLTALGWSRDVLDESLPQRVAFAGNHHPVLAMTSRDLLAQLDYDYDALEQMLAEQGWTTMQLAHRESDDIFHARNPFPPGGGRGGPGDWGGRGRSGRVSAVPATRADVTAAQHPPGLRHGTAESAAGGHPPDGGIQVSGSSQQLA